MILRLALRNVRRNLRRTLLTVGGMALAVAIMLTSIALTDGSWAGIMRSAIEGTAGHVVVQAPAWQVERDAELVVDDATGVRDALVGAYPEATVVRRTFIGGLVTSPTGSAPIDLRGIEPGPEAAITLLDDRVVDGGWPEEERDLLLGAPLAETLGVALGDKVVFMAQVGTGDMVSELFRVKGLYRTGGEALDSFSAFAPLATTQRLLPGEDPAHQVAAVFPTNTRGDVDTGPAERALDGRLGIDVLAWNEALPLLEEQAALDARFNHVIFIFMGLIVAVGVMNTVLMSVMERIREFGVMLAVGLRPRQLATLIVLEGAVMGVLGGLAGILLSLGPIAYLQRVGIDYGDMLAELGPVSGAVLDSTLRAQLIPWKLFFVGGVMAVMAVLASLWPARRATRLRPVDAMRHV